AMGTDCQSTRLGQLALLEQAIARKPSDAAVDHRFFAHSVRVSTFRLLRAFDSQLFAGREREREKTDGGSGKTTSLPFWIVCIWRRVDVARKFRHPVIVDRVLGSARRKWRQCPLSHLPFHNQRTRN